MRKATSHHTSHRKPTFHHSSQRKAILNHAFEHKPTSSRTSQRKFTSKLISEWKSDPHYSTLLKGSRISQRKAAWRCISQLKLGPCQPFYRGALHIIFTSISPPRRKSVSQYYATEGHSTSHFRIGSPPRNIVSSESCPTANFPKRGHSISYFTAAVCLPMLRHLNPTSHRKATSHQNLLGPLMSHTQVGRQKHST